MAARDAVDKKAGVYEAVNKPPEAQFLARFRALAAKSLEIEGNPTKIQWKSNGHRLKLHVFQSILKGYRALTEVQEQVLHWDAQRDGGRPGAGRRALRVLQGGGGGGGSSWWRTAGRCSSGWTRPKSLGVGAIGRVLGLFG